MRNSFSFLYKPLMILSFLSTLKKERRNEQTESFKPDRSLLELESCAIQNLIHEMSLRQDCNLTERSRRNRQNGQPLYSKTPSNHLWTDDSLPVSVAE